MKKLIVSVVLASLSLLAWALPTLQQVEAEVRQGHYAQAETMMREVVAAKPGSARAHYVYAEILAHDGKLALASEEAKKARTIDPDVKFADPEKFRTFEAALLRAQSPAVRAPVTPAPAQTAAPAQIAPAQMAPTRVAPAPAAAGMPSWVWLAGLAAVAFVLWRCFSRSRAAPLAGGVAAPGTGYGAPMQAGPMGAPHGAGAVGTPYGPGYAPQRTGSGMLGVGLGAAGGVAAGMLAERMLHLATRTVSIATRSRRAASSIRRRAAAQPATSRAGRSTSAPAATTGMRDRATSAAARTAAAAAAAAGTRLAAARSASQQAALLDERDDLGQAVARLQVGHDERPWRRACGACRRASRRGSRRRRARGRSC